VKSKKAAPPKAGSGGHDCDNGLQFVKVWEATKVGFQRTSATAEPTKDSFMMRKEGNCLNSGEIRPQDQPRQTRTDIPSGAVNLIALSTDLLWGREYIWVRWADLVILLLYENMLKRKMLLQEAREEGSHRVCRRKRREVGEQWQRRL
jgi:hypothetical protein